MGTRGAYGFYHDGQTKAAYNHFDSYPAGLGVEIVNGLFMALRGHVAEGEESVRKLLTFAFYSVQLVPEDGRPEGELMRNAQDHWHLPSPGEDETWYDWLRSLQGDIRAWMTPYVSLPMPNAVHFLGDSLFCEWAYIVNIDELMLEVYKGFNKDPNAEGRYARVIYADDSGYAGVRLVKTIPLMYIARNPAGAIALMETLEEDLTDE